MNTLRKKTNLLIYLLRLLQDTFNKIITVLIGSDMINTVLSWYVSKYLCSTGDAIFKGFFRDYAEGFSCLAIHFRQKELISFKFIYLLTQNSRAKLIP